MRYGAQIIVLGGGGEKSVRTLQEDKKLKKVNYFLREVSEEITKRIREGEIWYTDDYMDFKGDLEFNTEEDDE